MQKFYLSVICLLLLVSCRSANYEDLNPTIQPNINLLPRLEIKTDVSTYPKGSVNKTDAQNIFIKEAEENIIEQTGVKKGYIKMRTSYVEHDNNRLYRLSILPLYIPTLAGVPFDSSKYTTEIEVIIQDNKENVIKRYVERATDTEYAAFYWGYNKDSMERKASATSLKQALEVIRHKINADASEIRAKLK